MAVRQHLQRLAADGLVAERRVPRPRGRPAKAWYVTEAAHDRFPDAHRDLALSLLDALGDAFGPAGMTTLLAAREARQIADYRAVLADCGDDWRARTVALAGLRDREGYMAHVVADGAALLLVENHCPICEAARACSGLCRSELALFRAVLGAGVSVERISHLLDGALRCVYRVAPV